MNNIEQLETKIQRLRLKREAADQGMTKAIRFFVVLIIAMLVFFFMFLMIGIDEATSEFLASVAFVSLPVGLLYFLVCFELHMIFSQRIREAEFRLEMAQQRG